VTNKVFKLKNPEKSYSK